MLLEYWLESSISAIDSRLGAPTLAATCIRPSLSYLGLLNVISYSLLLFFNAMLRCVFACFALLPSFFDFGALVVAGYVPEIHGSLLCFRALLTLIWHFIASVSFKANRYCLSSNNVARVLIIRK